MFRVDCWWSPLLWLPPTMPRELEKPPAEDVPLSPYDFGAYPEIPGVISTLHLLKIGFQLGRLGIAG